MAAEDGQKKNIVVIGGGIIGCTSAYFLSRHPSFDPSKHTITLLEASKIAGGASGKAGGLLALWAYPSSLVPLSYKLHKELAQQHGGEERWGYRAVHCGSVDCKGRALNELRGKGNKDLKVDGKDNEMHGEQNPKDAHVSLEKRKNNPKLAAAGVPKDLDWVHADCLRVYDEMGDPTTTAQVHPFQFTTAMADLAAEKGVDIKTQSPVESINYTPDHSAVQSVTYTDTATNATRTLPATDVVLAAGPWTQSLYPSAPITSMRAHSVTIRPSRPVSAYALFTQIALPPNFSQTPESTLSHKPLSSKNKHSQLVSPEIYARPKNEVYACGEGDRLIPLPATTSEVQVDEKRCQDIVDYVSSISDELAQGEVTARQACYLPNVSVGSGSPLVGLTGVRGVVMAAGHTCWGIQNGPGTGKLVGEFVFEGKAESAKVQGLDPRRAL